MDEPPPLISLAYRNHGLTPIAEYLALLRQDRIMTLVDELDRVRAEITGASHLTNLPPIREETVTQN